MKARQKDAVRRCGWSSLIFDTTSKAISKKRRFNADLGKVLLLTLAVLILPVPMFGSGPTHVEEPDKPLYLLAGHVGGTYLTLADDMATAVQSDGIRVIPMVGRGSRQALADLIALDEVTLATLQSDVLDLSRVLGERVQDIHYITTLGFEEFHVVAPRSVASIFELEGQTVSIGPSESGSAVTARFIFSDLGIDIEPVTMSNREALEALQTGKIAAMTRVVAQPAPFFSSIVEGDFHFLEVPAGSIDQPYVKSTLRPESYPLLLDDAVETVAVAAVLAALFDPADAATAKAIEKFTSALFSRMDYLRTGPHHPKWKVIEPRVDLAGWPRLPAAQIALDAGVSR